MKKINYSKSTKTIKLRKVFINEKNQNVFLWKLITFLWKDRQKWTGEEKHGINEGHFDSLWGISGNSQ